MITSTKKSVVTSYDIVVTTSVHISNADIERYIGIFKDEYGKIPMIKAIRDEFKLNLSDSRQLAETIIADFDLNKSEDTAGYNLGDILQAALRS